MFLFYKALFGKVSVEFLSAFCFSVAFFRIFFGIFEVGYRHGLFKDHQSPQGANDSSLLYETQFEEI